MDIQTIGVIIASILGIIGAVGGIPQLMKWFAPKPHLRLLYGRVVPKSNNPKLRDDKQMLQYAVENINKRWAKNADATEVNIVFHVIDKDNRQRGEGFTCFTSHCLGIGENIPREYEINPETLLVKPQGNPHTLVFKITCKEKATAESRISYNFLDDLEARTKYEYIPT
jgi:hypothetical protein